MKKINLLYHRIKKYFTTNKLFSSIYFIGIFFAVVIVLYSYINFVAAKRESLINLNQTYTISIDSKIEEIPKKKWDEISSYFSTSGALSYMAFSRLDPTENNNDYFVKGDNYITAKCGEEYELIGSGTLSLEGSDPDCAIVNEHIIKPEKRSGIIGKTINVKGEAFKIVGFITTVRPAQILINFDKYYSLALKTESIRFVFRGAPSEEALQGLRSLFSEEEGYRLIEPTPPSNNLSYYTVSVFIRIFTIYFIGMITVFLLFKFLIKSRESEIIVMALCGATKTDINLLLLGDIIVLSVLPTALAILIYAILEQPFISKIYAYTVLYNLKDYAIVFLSILVINIIAMIPFLSNISNSSVIKAKQHIMR